MSISERVKVIMDHFGHSPGEIARKVGVTHRTISRIYKGETTPKVDLLANILLQYPTVSPEWILYGKGKMTKSQESDGVLLDSEDLDENSRASGEGVKDLEVRFLKQRVADLEAQVAQLKELVEVYKGKIDRS